MRNPQPSEEELKSADFLFHRTYDEGTSKILDKIDDEIAGVDGTFCFLSYSAMWLIASLILLLPHIISLLLLQLNSSSTEPVLREKLVLCRKWQPTYKGL